MKKLNELWVPRSRKERWIVIAITFFITGILMNLAEGNETLESLTVIPFIAITIYSLTQGTPELKAEDKSRKEQKAVTRAVKAEKQEAQAIQKEAQEVYRLEKKTRDTTPRCPRCGSTSLTSQKKGFRMGRAVVGSVASLGVGALAGAAGSRKIDITCLNCGKKFKPGKGKYKD